VSKNYVYMVGNICVSAFSDITLTYKLAHIFYMLCSPHISNLFTVGRFCHYQVTNGDKGPNYT